MKLLNDLSKLSSTLDKKALLAKASTTEQRVFHYAYDQLKTYGLKFVSVAWHRLGEPIPEMFNLLDNLAARKITGNAARITVEQFADKYGDLIKLVCNKDLRCGVTATLFDSVHKKNKIKQHKVMLAKEVPLEQLKFPMLGQIKYDGVRITILKHQDSVRFITRNGKEVHLPGLANTLASIEVDRFVLDCEVTYAGSKDERTKVSGLINSAMHGSAIDESGLVFHVFDAMNIDDFMNQQCDYEYDARWNYLVEILSELRLDWLRPAMTIKIESKHDAQLYYESLIEEGWEGMILKPMYHKYEFKRSKSWVKMKETKTADLLCTGMVAGTGKYEGLIGALICVGKVEGKPIIVNVGSGLSDLDRAMAFTKYKNKTIEVKYNAIIQDKATLEWSLFLPRFSCVRIDK